MMHFDLIVIGAGPAGCNFLRLLRPDLRVLLVDASCRRRKVCAGLLSPDAQDLMARYGIHLPTEILSSPQLFRVRTVDLRTSLRRDYRRSYLNMNRSAFDNYMRSLVPSHVVIVKGLATAVSRRENRYHITVQVSNQTEEYTADAVIGADGASSVVRRDLFSKRPLTRYTAIQQWFHSDGADPYYSCLFDSETSDSCSWVFFKDDCLIFGGAFPQKNSRARFEEQKRLALSIGALPKDAGEGAIRTEACCVALPKSPRDLCLGGRGAYLIGEAAGLISPSSLEGISYALKSGEHLARSLNRCSSPARGICTYRLLCLPLMLKVILRRAKHLVLSSPFLRGMILRSGILSLPPTDFIQHSERNQSI